MSIVLVQKVTPNKDEQKTDSATHAAADDGTNVGASCAARAYSWTRIGGIIVGVVCMGIRADSMGARKGSLTLIGITLCFSYVE